ncbi:flavodoxin family protein [Clostridium sp.]|uniref:flavodoxin family protein n=1 Tax=Clostridium sp. TaxID=1506 RepID=UPI003D6D016F
MNKMVLFFSRTGNSKRVATKIANGLGLKPIEITDDKNWNGIFGYLKGGYYASVSKSVNIKVNGDYKQVDEYIVVSPLWAGVPAPSVREFLKQVPISKVNLVLTCKGSNIENALTKYESKSGKLKAGFGIIENLNDEDKRVEEIIQALK